MNIIHAEIDVRLLPDQDHDSVLAAPARIADDAAVHITPRCDDILRYAQ